MTDDPLEQKLNSLRFPAPDAATNRAILGAAQATPASVRNTTLLANPVFLLVAFAAAALLIVLMNLPSDSGNAGRTPAAPRMGADETGEELERPWGTTVDGVRCSIQLDAKSYYPHQLIRLDYVLENTKDSESFLVGAFGAQLYAGHRMLCDGPADITCQMRNSKEAISFAMHNHASQGLKNDVPRPKNKTLARREAETGSFALSAPHPGKYFLVMTRGQASSNTVEFDVKLPTDKEWAEAVKDVRAYQRLDKKTYAPGEPVYFHWLVENLLSEKNTSFEGSMSSYWNDAHYVLFDNGFDITVSRETMPLEHNDRISGEWHNSSNHLKPHEVRGGLIPLDKFWPLDRAGAYQAAIKGGWPAASFAIEIPAGWLWGESQNGLRAHAHTDKKTYAPGEPILATLIVHNDGAADAISDGFIETYADSLSLVNEAKISITNDTDHAPVQQTGNVKLQCDDYVTAPKLAPGQLKAVTVNLAQYWKLDAPGSYTLMFHMGSPESNVVTFEVRK